MKPAEAIAYSDSYLRMKNFRHNLELARTENFEKGYDKGIEKGIRQGIEKGQRDERFAIAGNMLRHNVSIEMICSVTGLSKEEVNSINNQGVSKF